MKRTALTAAAAAALSALAFAGCGQVITTTTGTPPAVPTTTTRTESPPNPVAPPKPKPKPKPVYRAPQGEFSLPNPSLTPGAIDPRVTQANIHATICVAGYTQTVRPPASVTGPEKRVSMAAYGDTGPVSAYEYDHLISLELGGSPNDSRNLWPEPGASPNPKDGLENHLHSEVCSGAISLATAQHEIATDWVAAWHAWQGVAPTPTATTPTPTPTPRPHSKWHVGEFCSVSKEAQYEQAGFHCVSSGNRHRLQGG